MTICSKVCVIVENIGPYHHARFEAVSKRLDLTVIQVNTKSSVNLWPSIVEKPNYQLVLLDQISKQDSTYTKIKKLLKHHQPDVVFASGWAKSADIAAIIAAYFAHIPVVVMSESQQQDKKRNRLIEFLKKKLLSLAQGVFAGGVPHKEYATLLGIDPQFIRTGGNAVDNAHFGRFTQQQNKLQPCFIAVGRLVPKKNHLFLLQSFARYVEIHSKTIGQDVIWRLKLAGDGHLKQTLEDLAVQLNISKYVDFLGYVEYNDLPKVYSEASAFVHLSSTEQWGLVVNEAMSAGLPVYVSSRCGCAVDLVHTRINGFILSEFDVAQCADTLLQIATTDPNEIIKMGHESKKIIAQWGTENFATNFVELAQAVMTPNIRKKTSPSSVLIAIAIMFISSLREYYHGGIIE